MRFILPILLCSALKIFPLTLNVTVGGDANSTTGGTFDAADVSGHSGDLRYCLNFILNEQAQSNLLGPYDVVFDTAQMGSSTVSLNARLPIVNLFEEETVTIGNGSGTVTITNGTAGSGGLYIRQGGAVTLQNLDFTSCSVQGGNSGTGGAGGGLGAGGALYIDAADVTLINVNMTSNQVRTGRGDATNGAAGGGGLSGNGGDGGVMGNRGGGGGYSGNGGNGIGSGNTYGGGGGLANGGIPGDTYLSGGGGAAILGAVGGGNSSQNGQAVTPSGSGTAFVVGGGGAGALLTNAGDGGGTMPGTGAAGSFMNPGPGGGGGGFDPGSSGDGTPGAMGGNGGVGGRGGGGGGGGLGTGGVGGIGAGGGGGTGAGGNGGYAGGGGGGGADPGPGGDGGFGGGGGGLSNVSILSAGDGGFGGGGGGTDPSGTGTGGGGGFGGGGGKGNPFGAGGVGGVTASMATGGDGAAFGGGIFLTNASLPYAGSYGWGPGTLRMEGNCSLSGNTVAQQGGATGNSATAGADLFLMSGTTLELAPGSGNTITFAGSIGDDSSNTLPGGTYMAGSGTGANVTALGGGTVVLTGTSTYIGATGVEASTTLVVNGSIAASVTVDVGAIVKGVGHIGTYSGSAASIVNGTVQPGNSIGTLFFDSGLTLGASSTTSIEFDPATSSLIDVTGSASLAGTLQMVPQAGTYTGGTTYTVLSATTGVTGTFSSVVSSDPSFPFPLNVIYPTMAPWDVLVILGGGSSSLLVSQMHGNNRIVADYLNSLGSNFLGTPFNMLASLPFNEQVHAVEMIDPDRLTFATFTSQNLAFNLAKLVEWHLGSYRQMRRAQLSRVAASSDALEDKISQGDLVAWRFPGFSSKSKTDDSLPGPSRQPGVPVCGNTKPWNVWMTGFGELTDQNEEHQNPAFDATLGGLLAGFDWDNIENGVFGGGVAYTHAAIHADNHFGSQTLNGGYATLYASVFAGDAFFNFALWGGYQHISSERNIIFSSFDETAQSSYSSGQLQPHFSFGYDWYFCSRRQKAIEPFVSFDWVANFTESFSETGAAPFNMAVESQYASMLQSQAGFNFYLLNPADWGDLVFRGQFSYINRLPFDTGRLTAAIVSAPGSFTVTTFTDPQNLFSPNAEIYYQNENGYYGSITYDGEFGSGYIMNEIALRFGRNF